jgi:cell division protein FtsB
MRFSWRLIVDVIAPALFTCWIGYFAYGAVVGATGLRVLTSLRAEEAQKTQEVAALLAERRRLEQVATQLNPRSLDADMVDEKVRVVLGYVEEGDIVIPRDQLDELLKSREAAGAP